MGPLPPKRPISNCIGRGDTIKYVSSLRPLVLLTALLAALQPAMAPCACKNCTAACSGRRATASPRPCCQRNANGRMACCGSRQGECPCQSSKPHAGCLCSAQPHVTAVTAPVVAVDHAPIVDHWLDAGCSAAAHATPPAIAFGRLIDRGPPTQFAALRVHACFEVWII